LIGTDGINSEVRHALKKQLPELGESFECEEQVLPGAFKVFSQDLPSGLEPAAIHAMSSTSKDSSGFGLFLIPAPNNKICTLVNWKDEKVPPKVLLETAGVDALLKAIKKDFPLFGEPQRDAAEQLQLQSPSIAMTIKCKPYASGNACVLLLGDSAHSTGGTLGQGANSALMDVVALDKSLDKYDDNLYLGLREYSDTQEPEGTSLFKLLQLPPKGLFGVLYQIEQLIRGFLSRLLPWIFPKPMQNALSQSLVPFRKIVQQNLLWVWLATRSSPKF
jgi:kynurenine 3-monooxygenase